MKKLYSLLSAVLVSVSIWAQVPQSFSYQAVIRGANNELVSNKSVGMKISIMQSSEYGNSVYVETHTPTTNTNGLVSIAIGNGTKLFGEFQTIDWAKGLRCLAYRSFGCQSIGRVSLQDLRCSRQRSI